MSKRIRHPKKNPARFSKTSTDLKVGDCIVVKPGIKELRLLVLIIGGWQAESQKLSRTNLAG